MTDVPVRIRMKVAADGLKEGTEWFAYRDGGGWFSVPVFQGSLIATAWRCIMPGEAVVVEEYTDGISITHDVTGQTTHDTEENYSADGYPYPRPARWIRTSPLNPDMADMADPPDKEDR